LDDESTHGSGEVEDHIRARHQLVDQFAVQDAALDEPELVPLRRGEVFRPAGAQVVQADDLVSRAEQAIHEMGADESGGPGDQHSHHGLPTGASPLRRWCSRRYSSSIRSVTDSIPYRRRTSASSARTRGNSISAAIAARMPPTSPGTRVARSVGTPSRAGQVV